jgi:DNA-binding NarL/FixJ family response regulator
LFTEYSYASSVVSLLIKMSCKDEKEKIKVLLVCYDPGVAGTAKSCLEVQGGLCIETASSNSDALAKIEKTKPDVIIGDFTGLWMHARTKGSELVNTLRSKGDMTPFIVLSYDDEKALIADVLRLAAVGFVGKSGDPSTVYSNLKNYIATITGRSIDREKR